jgi:hypothetical protein
LSSFINIMRTSPLAPISTKARRAAHTANVLRITVPFVPPVDRSITIIPAHIFDTHKISLGNVKDIKDKDAREFSIAVAEYNRRPFRILLNEVRVTSRPFDKFDSGISAFSVALYEDTPGGTNLIELIKSFETLENFPNITLPAHDNIEPTSSNLWGEDPTLLRIKLAAPDKLKLFGDRVDDIVAGAHVRLGLRASPWFSIQGDKMRCGWTLTAETVKIVNKAPELKWEPEADWDSVMTDAE